MILPQKETPIKSFGWKVYVGLIIGGLFLYLALRQINFAVVFRYIQDINPLWLLPAVLLYSTAFFIRAVRWKLLVNPLKEFPAHRLFSFLILGFFMNNVFPLRLGELIRAHVTGQKIGASRSSILATVVVERLFDGLSYIFLFLFTILFLPFPGWVRNSFTFGAVLFTAVLALFYFLSRKQELAASVFAKIPLPSRIAGRLLHILTNFLGGLKILGNFSVLAKVLCLSLIVWTIEGTVFLILATAFDLHINLLQCFLVMVIIGIGAILPTAPGYVGTVEFLGVTSLSFLGVPKNPAFAFIITLHTMQLLTIFAWGIYSLVSEKISFGELVKIEKQQ